MLPYQPKDARELLGDLGVGRFNTTMIVETLFMAPKTTEVASPPVMMLVGQIQVNLNQMGARLQVTGTIDDRTHAALVRICGPNYLSMSWYDVVKCVVHARQTGKQLIEKIPIALPAASMGDMPLGLPDVPGGIVTYAVGAFLLYRHLKKRKA